MELVPGIKLAIQTVLAEKYNYQVDIDDILVNETKPEFSGDYTVVLFSFSKILKTSPDKLGRDWVISACRNSIGFPVTMLSRAF
jgi:arginyl-tRNA synthetase